MRPIDDLREKIDLWKKSTTDTALMSVLCDVLKQIDVAIYEMDHKEAERTWHRVDEPPKKTGKYAVCWTYQEKPYWDWLIFLDGNWELQAGLPLPDYWMPIEPPKEDA